MGVWVDKSIRAVVKFDPKERKLPIARSEQRFGFLKKQSKLPGQGGQCVIVNGYLSHGIAIDPLTLLRMRDKRPRGHTT